MPIEPNSQLLHYSLTEKIGEGGMGAVWRAHDTTLNRDVAIKLLPQVFAEDPERLARFEREAKLLASLNHPNIAAIYGLHQEGASAGAGQAPGVRFLAMELVGGEDLQQRLQRGPLSVDEALKVAVQMAAGIEAAHDRGVIHRDLKPANVIVSPEGHVKLLDFGLAKALESDRPGADSALSPTMTSAGTVAGMILGTAAYMSPEQARGRPLDRRTDLWSFGCVLYECLVGKSLFAGETVSDSLAAILRKDPDWSKLPADTPPMVRLLLRRCLTRDPAKRLKDAGDARLELEQAIEDPDVAALGITAAPAITTTRSSTARRIAPWGVAAVALLTAAFFALTGNDAPHPPERRLMIPVPGATTFGDNAASPPVVSPDGRHVVFGVTENYQTHLWIRPLDSFEGRRLPGTENAEFAFWAPDNRHVGFFSGGWVKRIEIGTGRTQPVTNAGSFYPRGASWNGDGKIIFAPDSNTGIHIVDATGGEPRQLTTPDPEVVDSSHRWPHFLPDGEHFLFLSWTNDLTALREHGGVFLASIAGDFDPVRVLADASRVVYAAPGYLLVLRDDDLIAVPFDADKLQVTGDARVIADGVLRSRDSGHGAFSVSSEGTLVYARDQISRPATLSWYDRAGNATPAAAEPSSVVALSLSPDATRAVAELPGASGDREIWLFDLVRGVRTRLASGPFSFMNPIWSPDGDRVLLNSQEHGHSDLFTRATDGSDEQTEMLVDEMDKQAWDWSRDGDKVLYWPIGSGEGTSDIWIYSVSAGQSEPVIQGDPSYTMAKFSPDDRHIVYASDESGRVEVFAHSIESGARRQVSIAGGTNPSWRGDGKEILYRDLEGRMMAVALPDYPRSLDLGAPVELFTIDDVLVAGDATDDHQRFLLATQSTLDSEPLFVILNWLSGLEPAD